MADDELVGRRDVPGLGEHTLDAEFQVFWSPIRGIEASSRGRPLRGGDPVLRHP